MAGSTPNSTTKQGLRALRANLGNAWRNDRRMVFKSITAWILFSGIIVVFIFLGNTPQQMGVSTGGTAASVNGQIVSIAEFSEQVELMGRDPRFAQLQQFGGDFAAQMIRSQAIQALIDQRLLGQNLGKMGWETADAYVRDAIAEIPAFQEDGRFSKTRYLGYLQATRQSPGEFEEKLRRQLGANRAARTFSAALRPLAIEPEIVGNIEDRKANVEAISIPTESLVLKDGVTAADTTAFLATESSKAKVKSYFDSHKADFTQAERAKVRHVLVRAEKGNADSIAAAKAKAEAIAAEIKAGADFAKVAKEKSDDPGSKADGGLIDFFARGSMVPEFETYAFSAKPGEISTPIQTDFGFHVIRVEERKPATSQTLEEAQDDIAQILISQERSREEVAALEKSLVAGDVAAVQAFVTRHKLMWTETGAFPLSSEELPKVGGGDEAVSTAFRLTAEKPYAPRLVRRGPEALLLKYRAVPKELNPVATKAAAGKGKPGAGTESPEFKFESTASRRIDEAFGQWMDGLRKSAEISVSPEVGARTAAAGPQ